MVMARPKGLSSLIYFNDLRLLTDRCEALNAKGLFVRLLTRFADAIVIYGVSDAPNAAFPPCQPP